MNEGQLQSGNNNFSSSDRYCLDLLEAARLGQVDLIKDGAGSYILQNMSPSAIKGYMCMGDQVQELKDFEMGRIYGKARAKARREEMIALLRLHGVTEGDNILDVFSAAAGCTENMYDAFVDGQTNSDGQTPLCHGVDRDENMVNFARNHVKKSGKQISFFQGDALNLRSIDGLKPGEYDTVTARHGLQYTGNNAQGIVSQLAQMPRVGGRVIITDLTDNVNRFLGAPWKVLAIQKLTMQAAMGMTGFRPDIGKKHPKMLKKAGLKNIITIKTPYNRFGPLASQDPAEIISTFSKLLASARVTAQIPFIGPNLAKKWPVAMWEAYIDPNVLVESTLCTVKGEVYDSSNPHHQDRSWMDNMLMSLTAKSDFTFFGDMPKRQLPKELQERFAPLE